MNLIKLLGSAALAALLVTTAQAQDTVKIGWAIPKSGPERRAPPSPRCRTTRCG